MISQALTRLLELRVYGKPNAQKIENPGLSFDNPGVSVENPGLPTDNPGLSIKKTWIIADKLGIQDFQVINLVYRPNIQVYRR